MVEVAIVHTGKKGGLPMIQVVLKMKSVKSMNLRKNL